MAFHGGALPAWVRCFICLTVFVPVFSPLRVWVLVLFCLGVCTFCLAWSASSSPKKLKDATALCGGKLVAGHEQHSEGGGRRWRAAAATAALVRAGRRNARLLPLYALADVSEVRRGHGQRFWYPGGWIGWGVLWRGGCRCGRGGNATRACLCYYAEHLFYSTRACLLAPRTVLFSFSAVL